MCKRIYRKHNKMIYNSIKKFFKSIIGILRILKQGNYFSYKQFSPVPNNKMLRILGNGKSLNEVSLNENKDIDYLVVNRHVLGDNYTNIKPSYYVLADPYFFNHQEGINIIKEINAKTTWPLNLCIVYNRTTKKKIRNIINNPYITLITYNTCSFDGYNRIKYLTFNWQLAMPVVQNVLVASLMIGIQKKYSIIELYGVEHTWTKYLFVNDNNVVYLENPHFFDKEKVAAKPVKEIQHTEEYPFYLILKNYSRMFESYWDIKEYLKTNKKNTKVINCTEGSFIDAFERKH